MSSPRLQMAFSFSKLPCSRDYNYGPHRSSSHESNMNQHPKSSHESNMNQHPKSSSLSSSSSRANGWKCFAKGVFNKLIWKSGSSEKKEKGNALIEVKGNTTTLDMVLRSERELLSVNEKQEVEISKLKLMIKNKNKEVNLQVEKLMDLCLNQREEIKSLMSSILSHGSSPRTPPPHGREDASNSWESSSEDMSDDSKTTWR